MPKKLPKHVRHYAKTGKFRAVVERAGEGGKRGYGPLRSTPEQAATDALKLLASRSESRDVGPTTVAEAFGFVLADIAARNGSSYTARFYRDKLKVLTGPHGWDPDFPIGAISAEQIRAYARKRERSVRTETAWHDLTALRRALNLAIRDGHLKENPFDRVTKPKTRQQRYEFLTTDQIRDITDRVRSFSHPTTHGGPERFARLIELFFFTGLRRLEMASLTTKDVRLGAGVVRVHEHTKTGHRDVPLSAAAREAAEYLIEHSPRPGYVTQNPTSISVRFARWRERLGEEHLSPHVLRHSFATAAVEADVQPFVLAQLMGHKSLKMTMRYYHGRDAVSRDAVERLTLNPHREGS